MDTALPQKFPFILDRNLAKANCTGNRVCTSCDTVVLELNIKHQQYPKVKKSRCILKNTMQLLRPRKIRNIKAAFNNRVQRTALALLIGFSQS